jgi:MarR family transcriptional regulator, organic hydroperoxide resistance regulator
MSSGVNSSAMLFDVVDWLRNLIGSNALAEILTDLTKNDFLALLFVYRSGPVAMSQIAEYLGVPANTATGVVNRLQKRGFFERAHSESDKRIVTISVSEAGVDAVSAILRRISRYQAAAMAALTNEELRVLVGVAGKLVGVLEAEATADAQPPVASRRITID